MAVLYVRENQLGPISIVVCMVIVVGARCIDVLHELGACKQT